MKVAPLLGPVLLALTVAAHPLHQDSGSAIVQARNAAENEYNDFVAWRLSRRGFDKHEIDAELQKRQWPFGPQTGSNPGNAAGSGFNQAPSDRGPFWTGSNPGNAAATSTGPSSVNDLTMNAFSGSGGQGQGFNQATGGRGPFGTGSGGVAV